MATKYVCTEIDKRVNIYGNHNCKIWSELQTQQPASLIPNDLTQEQANDITLAVISVMVLVWGWQMAIKLIKRS